MIYDMYIYKSFPLQPQGQRLLFSPKKMSKTALVNIWGNIVPTKKSGDFLRFKLATFLEGKIHSTLGGPGELETWTRLAAGSSTRIGGTMYDQYPQCTGLVCHLVIDG